MDKTIWTLEEIRAHIADGLPLAGHFGMVLIHAEADCARVRLDGGDHVLRPGGSVAGPILFGMADVAVYALILAERGDQHAVTVDMTMNFLRPGRTLPIIAEARTLRAGRRLFTAEIRIASAAEPGRPVASASATYALSS